MKESKPILILVVLLCSVVVSAKDDIILFRDTTNAIPSVGQWYVSYTGPNSDPNSGLNGTLDFSSYLGAYLDTPLVGDIDGDGVDDVVVVSEAGGNTADPNDDGSCWTVGYTKRDIYGDGLLGFGGASSLYLGRFFRAETWYDLNDPNQVVHSLLADVNGDGQDDVIRVEATGAGSVQGVGALQWRAYHSGENGLSTIADVGSPDSNIWWGENSLGDIPLTGDFDGDGYEDAAVFRSGLWVVAKSTSDGLDSTNTVSGYFGSVGDIPLVGDMDNDGRDDAVVVRWEGGQLRWYVCYADATGLIDWVTNGGADLGLWGWWGGDIPVLADFDEDGQDDIGVFRNATGEWIFLLTADGTTTITTSFGGAGDEPLIGEFNGLPGKPADINDSGKVDLVDLADLALYWLGIVDP